MSELIRRPKTGEQIKEQFATSERSQVSLNSDDRLVVRFIGSEGDVLVVFDSHVSGRIVRFCQERIRGRDDSRVPF